MAELLWHSVWTLFMWKTIMRCHAFLFCPIPLQLPGSRYSHEDRPIWLKLVNAAVWPESELGMPKAWELHSFRASVSQLENTRVLLWADVCRTVIISDGSLWQYCLGYKMSTLTVSSMYRHVTSWALERDVYLQHHNLLALWDSLLTKPLFHKSIILVVVSVLQSIDLF